MDQAEFDALEDPEDHLPEQTGRLARIRALIAAQGPVRIGAIGLLAVTAILFGAFKPLGPSPRIAVSQVENMTPKVVPTPLPIPAAAADPDALPSVPSAPAAVAVLPPAPIRIVEDLERTQGRADLAEVTGDALDRQAQATLPVAVPDCTVVIDTTALAGAIVALDIAAPCDGGARAEIFMGDLQVAYALDDDGQLQIQLPALGPAVSVAVLIEGRIPVSTLATVEDMDDYNRAVLFWQGDMGLRLHAFEGDADFGTEGHVGPDDPKSIARALSGNGGYMTVLGDPDLIDPQMAEVYTAPVDQTVLLSVEAPVTAANCGQEVFAGTIQTGAASGPELADLRFLQPDCAAVGDIVFFSNLMEIPPQAETATN